MYDPIFKGIWQKKEKKGHPIAPHVPSLLGKLDPNMNFTMAGGI